MRVFCGAHNSFCLYLDSGLAPERNNQVPSTFHPPFNHIHTTALSPTTTAQEWVRVNLHGSGYNDTWVGGRLIQEGIPRWKVPVNDGVFGFHRNEGRRCWHGGVMNGG